jgi:Tfp pilus assembly PilM family ATPase
VGEIATTLDFFRASAAESAETAETDPTSTEVGRVVLSGSGARLGGLRELLEDRLGKPVSRFDVRPLVKGARSSRLTADEEAALTVAAGLCAGGRR